MDITVGGNQIPGGNPGSLVVWAVTAHGRVLTKYLNHFNKALSNIRRQVL